MPDFPSNAKQVHHVKSECEFEKYQSIIESKYYRKQLVNNFQQYSITELKFRLFEMSVKFLSPYNNV